MTHNPSGQFITTGFRRVVTPNGGDCKGIPPKLALNQVEEV